MKHTVKRLISILFSILLAITSCITSTTRVEADEASDLNIFTVVSLGDSYASGEGIEEFYGQSDRVDIKVNKEDWYAHRSQNSWGGMIKIPGTSKLMKDYKTTSNDGAGRWYFKASSGATTRDMTNKQIKEIARTGINNGEIFTRYVNPQLDVFDRIDTSIDYVTLSLGGNDVHFADVITQCVLGSQYLMSTEGVLLASIAAIWANIDAVKTNLKNVYGAISDKVDSNTAILVTGYPKLLNPLGSGFLFNSFEANTVNRNVSKFNNVIEDLVQECRVSGMNIHFVDVESEFSGHEAYTLNSWIHPVILMTKTEDLIRNDIKSAYSMHPKLEGAQAYAKCVNEKISEIERLNHTGTLSGKICKASDRSTPVPGAKITVYKDDKVYGRTTADSLGNYNFKLQEGSYKVVISESGYLDFTYYARVLANEINYIETFLLIQGNPDSTGSATGYIYDAVTGAGVGEAFLYLRKGWNNITNDHVEFFTTSNADGSYKVTAPLGNYTLYALKEGYIPVVFNIIIQEGTTTSQNGTMSPVNSSGEVSGDTYRIVLTWGENPRDLDSHTVGTLSGGSGFHVYYSNKSAYDGSTEVCNLDVDDTTSYGPETTTLKVSGSKPYYYYIHRYSGSGSIATSAAQIKVYKGSTLVRTFNVPTNLGTSDYWNVFAIVDGRIIVKNTMTTSPDTGYAGESVGTNSLFSLPDKGEQKLFDDSQVSKSDVTEEQISNDVQEQESQPAESESVTPASTEVLLPAETPDNATEEQAVTESVIESEDPVDAIEEADMSAANL